MRRYFNFNLVKLVALSLGFLGMAGCAHSYYYVPEIAGNGATFTRGGVLYVIPPDAPKLRMKLVSLGVKTTKEQKKILHIRMYFVRLSSSTTPEYLDVLEQSLVLPSSSNPINPTKVHANTKQRPIIELANTDKQAIEFLFELPQGSAGANSFQSFLFRWKVHYDGKVEEQTTRFDRQDMAPQQGVGESDYPPDEEEQLEQNSPWIPQGWGWW
jgi:hypothetical protein